MRDALRNVIQEYPAARLATFAGHPLAQFIRGTLQEKIGEALGDLGNGLIRKGSPGAGNWAAVPWAGVFDPLVTDSAESGYYIVYLFSAKEPEVFLSLNQGTTAAIDEFKGRALEVLSDRAALMRARLSDYAKYFDTQAIQLGSNLRLPKGYEAGHAFGKKYRLDELPDEEQLREDLQNITRAYLTLTFRGGLEPTPELTPAGQGYNEDDAPKAGATLTEVRQYRLHRKIDRHPRAAKEAKAHHGTNCQACDFSFATKYGAIGEGFIEAHHRYPLGQLEEGVPVNYNVATDFLVLCSNCHRMIHRTDDPSNIEAFKRLVRGERD